SPDFLPPSATSATPSAPVAGRSPLPSLSPTHSPASPSLHSTTASPSPSPAPSPASALNTPPASVRNHSHSIPKQTTLPPAPPTGCPPPTTPPPHAAHHATAAPHSRPGC